jgi:hypothetical protein
MTPIASMVRTLIDAGTPPDVAAVVVAEAYALGINSVAVSGGIPVDEVAEKRRAYDRERKRNERNSGGSPVESGGSPESALTPKKDILKKVSKRKPIPPDWKPSEVHFAKAAEMNIPRSAVEAKAEDMRIWAGSSGAVKADWDLTFHGFLRRDAPKLAIRGSPSVSTITPESPSWNPWRSFFRDTGKRNHVKLMDKSASDGKPFTVQSEWPPGMAA